MVSLIICSRTADLSKQLRDNIEITIGCAYEFIVIDNSHNTYNIFEAYNLGVSRSKGDVLCFLHDDVYFHTIGWGNNVKKHFTNPEMGAIGIAGTRYVTKTAGSWWAGGLIDQNLCFNENSTLKKVTKYSDGKVENAKEVVVMDGVWLCIRKALFEKIRFDEGNFNGFHFYDIDICMQIYITGYKLMVIFDVLIEHNSPGQNNVQWMKNAKIFKEKWIKHLPIFNKKISFNAACQAELRTIREFSQIIIGNSKSSKEGNLYALEQLFGNYKLYFYYKMPWYAYFFLRNILIQTK